MVSSGINRFIAKVFASVSIFSTDIKVFERRKGVEAFG